MPSLKVTVPSASKSRSHDKQSDDSGENGPENFEEAEKINKTVKVGSVTDISKPPSIGSDQKKWISVERRMESHSPKRRNIILTATGKKNIDTEPRE